MSAIVRPSTIETSSGRTGAEPTPRTLPLGYTLLVAVLALAAVAYGLLADGAYRVSEYQQAIWRGQDVVTLATVPVLVWAALRARSGSLRGHLVWVGIMFWLAYCYAHFAFALPYTSMFLVHVAILGLSGYGLLDGLLRIDVAAVAPAFDAAPRRVATWFLTIGGVGVAGLWLSEILPGLVDGTLATYPVYDMPNPTHTLDLAWILPLSFAAAWMLRRRHPAGPAVSAVMLLTLAILSVAMLALTPFALDAGLHRQPEYEGLFTVFGGIFGAVLLVDAWIVVTASRRMRPITAPWLRPSLWPGVADRGS